MESAASKAYSHIRARIIDGTFPSGAFLVEQDLAGEIGVSRTPVRDALNRLETEGLVASEGNKRAMVRDFTEQEVEECFELRAQFESYAAAKAAKRIPIEDIEKLKVLAMQMEAVVKRGAPDASAQFSELNDQFHAIILEHGGSKRMRDLLTQLMQVQLVLMKRFRQTIETHLQRSCWHHRELIAAFEARDSAWAETQMRTHMLSAKNGGDLQYLQAAE